jgi:hypothetical protein
MGVAAVFGSPARAHAHRQAGCGPHAACVDPPGAAAASATTPPGARAREPALLGGARAGCACCVHRLHTRRLRKGTPKHAPLMLTRVEAATLGAGHVVRVPVCGTRPTETPPPHRVHCAVYVLIQVSVEPRAPAGACGACTTHGGGAGEAWPPRLPSTTHCRRLGTRPTAAQAGRDSKPICP